MVGQPRKGRGKIYGLADRLIAGSRTMLPRNPERAREWLYALLVLPSLILLLIMRFYHAVYFRIFLLFDLTAYLASPNSLSHHYRKIQVPSWSD